MKLLASRSQSHISIMINRPHLLLCTMIALALPSAADAAASASLATATIRHAASLHSGGVYDDSGSLIVRSDVANRQMRRVDAEVNVDFDGFVEFSPLQLTKEGDALLQ